MSEIKQLAYIELDCHSEVVNNFMTLMNGAGTFHVDYYLAESVIAELQLPINKNIILANITNIFSLLKNEYDLVIIGTANRNFNLYYKIALKYRTSTIVHNINFIQTPVNKIIQQLFFSNINIAFRLIYSGIYQKDLFLNHVQKLVLDEALVESNKKSNVSFLPLSFNQTRKDLKVSKVVNVVIPGTVSKSRRDYNRVLYAIKKFKSDISITFLGKATGEELKWIEEAKKEIPSNVVLIYFTENVPQHKFDDIMHSSDVIWSPIQSTINFCGVTEYYGKSKVSGNISDAIKFGKPILLPDFYESNLPFVFNEKEDTEQQLIELSKKDLSFEKYRRETILKQLENTLLSLLTK